MSNGQRFTTTEEKRRFESIIRDSLLKGVRGMVDKERVK